MADKKPKSKAKRRPPDPPIAGLTYKQRQFVSYYLGESNGNATDAARRAGYSCPEIGRQLLRKITIRAEIDRKLAGPAMAADEVLARLSEIAAVDLGDFISLTPSGDPFLNLKRARLAGKTHLLRKVKPSMHGTSIEVHDPLRALEKLGQYHRLFGDQDGPRGETGGRRLNIPEVDDRSGPQDEG